MTYTVIALHDTGEVYSTVRDAADADTAMRDVALEFRTRDLQIVCAIEGTYGYISARSWGSPLYTPCADTGKAAYAEDLADGTEGYELTPVYRRTDQEVKS